MHIITPICYSSKERIEYFKKYIEHVNKLENLDKINFLFFVEPHSEEMVELIPNHWNKQIFTNYYRYIFIFMCVYTMKSKYILYNILYV